MSALELIEKNKMRWLWKNTKEDAKKKIIRNHVKYIKSMMKKKFRNVETIPLFLNALKWLWNLDRNNFVKRINKIKYAKQ